LVVAAALSLRAAVVRHQGSVVVVAAAVAFGRHAHLPWAARDPAANERHVLAGPVIAPFQHFTGALGTLVAIALGRAGYRSARILVIPTRIVRHLGHRVGARLLARVVPARVS